MKKDIIKNEYINYSNYKADELIQINQYISEIKRGAFNCIANATGGAINLLISQTGSGKTHTIINILKEFNFKSIFIVPNATNVEQIMNEYDIPGAFGDICVDATMQSGNVVVMTWDKFSQLKDYDLSEYIAIVDEIHQTFNDMYRSDKINKVYDNLSKCKGRLDITATPNKLDFKAYNYIVEYKPTIQTDYKVKLYNKIDDTTILNIVNNSNKAAVFMDDTKYLEYIKASTIKKSEVLTSSRKDSSELYFNIVNNSCIGDIEVLLNTSVIVAGVNIKEPEITDIVVIGEKDISTIKQYVARFRNLKEVNVHIFNSKYNEGLSNTYEIEWRINEIINVTEKDIYGLNRINKNRSFIAQTLPITPFTLNSSFEFYYNGSEYKVNVPGIRNYCYMDYYRNADILSFKELLYEYFENIEVIQIEEASTNASKVFNKLLKVEKEEALKTIEEHKEIVVGVSEVLRGKISPKLDKYFRENRIDKDRIIEQIKDNNIPELLKVGNIKKLIDLYSKYIIDNEFTYELAWLLATKSQQARKQFIRQMNIQVFRKIENKYPELINNDLIENITFNIITSFLKPGLSFSEEHLEILLENLLNTHLKGVKMSLKEFRSIVNATFDIEVKQHRKGSFVSANSYLFIYNIVDFTDTPLEKMTRIYTIKGYKKIVDIVEEHQLSDISRKCLNNIINKRIKSIIESKEAQAILNVEKIFAS